MKKLILVITFLLFTSTVQATIIIDFTPSTSNVVVGDLFTVNLNFQDAFVEPEYLFSYNIGATYDPNLLQLRGGSVLNFFNLGWSSSSVNEVINPNTNPGQLQYFGTALAPFTKTQTSTISGTESIFTFEALAVGTSPLLLTTIDLRDSFNNPIPFSASNGAVNIISIQQPVPEPATLALMSLGLAGFAFKRRKQLSPDMAALHC